MDGSARAPVSARTAGEGAPGVESSAEGPQPGAANAPLGEDFGSLRERYIALLEEQVLQRQYRELTDRHNRMLMRLGAADLAVRERAQREVQQLPVALGVLEDVQARIHHVRLAHLQAMLGGPNRPGECRPVRENMRQMGDGAGDLGTVVDSALAVILPHYDCAGYLGMAVASVLQQDFHDLTLIVVDDSSPTDDWRAVLRPFAADPRLLVFRTSRNVGHLRIKNAVLTSVRSPYVGFQDADDISLPGRFRRQVDMLARRRADLVGCHLEHIDAQGRPIGQRRMPRNGNLLMRLGRFTVVHHPATVVRRELLDQLGGFDGTAWLGADTEFHMRAAYLYRLRNVGRVLYQYRVWPGSLTQAPETGFGSARREAYRESMRERERARRHARSPLELRRLLVAPLNDIAFTLHQVTLS